MANRRTTVKTESTVEVSIFVFILGPLGSFLPHGWVVYLQPLARYSWMPGKRYMFQEIFWLKDGEQPGAFSCANLAMKPNKLNTDEGRKITKDKYAAESSVQYLDVSVIGHNSVGKILKGD